MTISNGNLKNLFDSNLNEKSKQYWFDKLILYHIRALVILSSFEKQFLLVASIQDITSQIVGTTIGVDINIGTEGQF